MPSQSLQRWQTDGLSRLDEIENAHQSVGGPVPVAGMQLYKSTTRIPFSYPLSFKGTAAIYILNV